MDKGYGQVAVNEADDFTGWFNAKIVPALSDRILEQLKKIQRANQIAPSPKLEVHYNLTMEMETGVGKTYTYIKMILQKFFDVIQLHERYIHYDRFFRSHSIFFYMVFSVI